MFQSLHGKTADEVWRKAAQLLIDDLPWQTSRAGKTKEILRATLTVADPRQRWVLSRLPPLNPAFALAEVIWIMNGLNDADFLNFFNKSLPKFAGQGSTYHGAYGYRLRRHRALDQLERAYSALCSNPDTRQVVLQIWDGKEDLPDVNGNPSQPDIPCNLISCLNIRQGKLEWLQVLRSNDIFLGLPYNFVQFTTLQEVMAGWLGVELSSYNQISNSLHLYEHDVQKIIIHQPDFEAANNDSLALPKGESDKVFEELLSAARNITSLAISTKQICSRVRCSLLPSSYRNILLLVTSEGCRRRGNNDEALALARECSNPVLRYAMERWLDATNMKHTAN